MVTEMELRLCFESLQQATESNDIDRVVGLLNELNSSFANYGKLVDGDVFVGMMKLLDYSSVAGDAAWYIFHWFMDKGVFLGAGQSEVLREYVVENYMKFGSELLVVEVADWIAGWRDQGAIDAVRRWIDHWRELSALTKSGIQEILREMIDEWPFETRGGLFDEAKMIQGVCETLMREDRVGGSVQ